MGVEGLVRRCSHCLNPFPPNSPASPTPSSFRAAARSQQRRAETDHGALGDSEARPDSDAAEPRYSRRHRAQRSAARPMSGAGAGSGAAPPVLRLRRRGRAAHSGAGRRGWRSRARCGEDGAHLLCGAHGDRTTLKEFGGGSGAGRPRVLAELRGLGGQTRVAAVRPPASPAACSHVARLGCERSRDPPGQPLPCGAEAPEATLSSARRRRAARSRLLLRRGGGPGAPGLCPALHPEGRGEGSEPGISPLAQKGRMERGRDGCSGRNR
ncbi:uncharacterized protein LOC110396404 [Numida meleagris]|uniref:uncharacterized protein LOC110396404 n=1 Tax=Numida meleagris TaxID=8996 RepID=UPI000B3D8D03|nr:uncharacterized protein LOC110396404 [Numida meleagris]